MNRKAKGSARLVAFCCGMVIVWGAILPQVAKLRSVQSRIESFEGAGINPAAVFYTDHPGMKEIEQRVQSRLQSAEIERGSSR